LRQHNNNNNNSSNNSSNNSNSSNSNNNKKKSKSKSNKNSRNKNNGNNNSKKAKLASIAKMRQTVRIQMGSGRMVQSTDRLKAAARMAAAKIVRLRASAALAAPPQPTMTTKTEKPKMAMMAMPLLLPRPQLTPESAGAIAYIAKAGFLNESAVVADAAAITGKDDGKAAAVVVVVGESIVSTTTAFDIASVSPLVFNILLAKLFHDPNTFSNATKCLDANKLHDFFHRRVLAQNTTFN